MIKVKKTTITSAELLALNVTSKTILAAQVSGKVNNVIGISAKLDYNSIAYAGGFLQGYCNDVSPVVMFTNANILSKTADRTEPFTQASLSIASLDIDFKLKASAAITTGNSPIDIYVIYEEKDLI